MRILSSISSESVLVAIRMSHVMLQCLDPGVLRREIGDDLHDVQHAAGREHGIDPPAPLVEFLQRARRRADR